jgi:NAD(P)-dependent dehydrogenase (short-subunit alcohol dehydrogenase family)
MVYHKTENEMTTDISGKWALVTGASRGIGQQIALGLSGMGVHLVLHSSSNKYTRELAIELEGSGVLANMLDPGWCKTDMGGANAYNDAESVLPGALIPAMLGRKNLKRQKACFLPHRISPVSSGPGHRGRLLTVV